MKTISKIVLMGLMLISLNAVSQSRAKFGHIDTQKLLSIMPDRINAQNELQKHTQELETQLSAMQSELEKKYNSYLTQKDSLSELLKQTKEKELQDLQTRIQSFQAQAQQDLQKKQNELMQPIIQKVKDAVTKVAKDKGYSYIFDTSTGVLLYWPENSDDIFPLVKKELGIQ